MLMVIFGAGASYDSVEAIRPGTGKGQEENRPPVADQLFEDRPRFTQEMTRYRDCVPLIPRLRTRENGLSVEDMLGRLYEEAPTHGARYRQFAAIRFYLYSMICSCQRHWLDASKGITNHVALIDQIDRWLPVYGKVCLVTFNYDLWIEHALDYKRIGIRSLPDYISHPSFKLIKAHGSISWARQVRNPVIDLTGKDAQQVAFELIEHSEELEFADEFVWSGGHELGLLSTPSGRIPAVPALAIPLVAKMAFECPKAHEDALRDCIPAVSKVLVIGWRGAEQHFLQLLSGLSGGKKIPGLVVAGNRGTASEVIVGLSRATDRITWSASESGFSDFVTSGEADRFLSG
jgi:hypothetical protein